MIKTMFLLISSYMLDLVFGDPEWMVHPVRWVGRLIDKMEKILKGNSGIWVERIKGALLLVFVVGAGSFTAFILLKFSKGINPILGNIVWIYLAYTTIAVKDLGIKARAVFAALKVNRMEPHGLTPVVPFAAPLWGDSTPQVTSCSIPSEPLSPDLHPRFLCGGIEKARHELSKIVGRDTDNLGREEIIKAAIESISENTNDGIVAPIFYLVLGGPVLAIAYKAVNTLDSMIGYKNQKYIHFGWAAARLDDLANFIPARISGFLMSISSFILGKGLIGPLKIMFRDGDKHSSPNSGVSEAAMAGALGIKLGGGSFYRGKFVPKPYIGNSVRKIIVDLIPEALRISFAASVLMIIGGVFYKWII